MAFSPTLGVLMALRALLGLGESFNWPCALRTTSTILHPADRALGNGIFNSGAAVGAVVGPLLVPVLASRYDWRSSFVIIGSLGVLWVAAWSVMVRGSRGLLLAIRAKPLSSVAITKDGMGTRPSMRFWLSFGLLSGLTVLVASSFLRFGAPSFWWAISIFMIGLLLVTRILPIRDLSGWDLVETLGIVVRFRRFWVLSVVSISINVCWQFLVYWLPTYFTEDRKYSYLAGGVLSALPFLAADLGNLGGGAVSRWLTRRGMRPATSRIRVLMVCCLLICPGSLVGFVGNEGLIVGLIMTMAFGTAAFMANYFAFCQEVSTRHTGIVVGVVGGLGNLFVAGFLPLAGHVRDFSGSFGPIFVFVSLVPIVGLCALVLGWGKDDASSADGFASASDEKLS